MTIKDIIDYIKVKHIYNTDCYNKDCMEKDKKYMVMKQEGLVCQDCKFAHGFVTNQAVFSCRIKDSLYYFGSLNDKSIFMKDTPKECKYFMKYNGNKKCRR